MTDLKNIPIIDLHAHADSLLVPSDAKRTWVGEELYEIQKNENMPYMLYLSIYHERAIELARKHPDQIGVVLWVNPINEKRMEGLDEKIKNNLDVIRGLKIHPIGSGYYVSIDTVYEVFRLANKYDLLVITHTGSRNNEARMFTPVMEQFPKTKLILSHSFPLGETCEVIKSFENVYADCSYTADNQEAQRYLLDRLGKEKITYSIDGPGWFPKASNGKYISQYRIRANQMLPWYENDLDTIEHIYYKNAARLLKLDVS